MKILVVDQCSGSKKYPETLHELAKEEIDSATLDQLLGRSDTTGVPADELYSGRQQQRISEAVEILRSEGHDINRKFISAGFGLVGEKEELPPYEVTFSGMNQSEIDQRARKLRISEEVCDLLGNTINDPFDIIFFALGSDYYRAIDLDKTLSCLPSSTVTVLFNQEDVAKNYSNVIAISARTDDAEYYNAIVVELKGVYVKNFAKQIAAGDSLSDTETVRKKCLSVKSSQSGLDEFS